MIRSIRLVSRDGVPLVADYEEHELRIMRSLRIGLDGPDADWDRETMLMIHELKAAFPGAALVDDEGHIPEDDEFYLSGILSSTS